MTAGAGRAFMLALTGALVGWALVYGVLTATGHHQAPSCRPGRDGSCRPASPSPYVCQVSPCTPGGPHVWEGIPHATP